MTKKELLGKLDAMRGVIERFPDGEYFVDPRYQIHVYSPDERRIKSIFGQSIKRFQASDTADIHTITVDGVEVVWVVDREALNA